MFFVLLILWLVMNGRITLELMIFGVILAALVTLFAVKVIGYSIEKEKTIYHNIPIYLLYVVNLISEIIKSTFAVMGVILSGEKPDPVIIEFDSGLDSRFKNVLLANSITLTPGTYTLFMRGDHFVVHCLKQEYSVGMGDASFIRILRRLK